jgi:hypothetical protein
VIKDYEQANGVGIIGKLFGCMQEEHENNQHLDKMQLEKKPLCLVLQVMQETQ